MLYSDVLNTIVELGSDATLHFQSRADRIAHLLDHAAESDILAHLDHGGVIPEAFDHDSTEEKLYAKYCDALFARSLALLGMTTSVIEDRGDSADVKARFGGISLVGDAKAFRLSRTAKNQKDFKIEALNTWRRDAPYYQYPSRTSQIYDQASRFNVTLLSYTHLAYLLRHKPPQIDRLEELLQVGRTLTPSKIARVYWDSIRACLCRVTATATDEWEFAIRTLSATLPAIAKEQIAYWETEKQRIEAMSREEAVNALILARKIDSKIQAIRSTAAAADPADAVGQS